MQNNPYAKFGTADLILRDELAIDRTILANERTLLAYLRSAAALLIAGVSIIHFSREGWFLVIGIACTPVAALTGIIGIARYLRMKKAIRNIRQRN